MDTSAITNSIIESATSPASEPIESQPVENLVQDNDMARRIAILAKKEKSILENQKSFQQKMKELEEKEQRLGKWSKFEDINEENALDFFKEKGLSLEKIQEKWLSQLGDEDIDPIQKQIKELRSQLANKDNEVKKLLEETLSKRDTEAKQREIEEQSKYYNQELKKYLSENSEQYDLINTFEAADEVFNVIKDVYLKTAETGNPKLMTFDEAAGIYEEKLADLVKSMSKSKKVMQLLGVQSDDPVGQLWGQKTLDDSFNQTSATKPEYKTEQERLKAAAKLFESMVNQG